MKKDRKKGSFSGGFRKEWQKWRHHHKHHGHHKWFMNSSEESEESENEAYKDYDDQHPELVRMPMYKSILEHRHRRKQYVTQEMVDRLNKPEVTTRLAWGALILGLVYLAFGIIGLISLFGISENRTWKFYSATSFFGWEGHALTSATQIIIAIVIFWSFPYYQKKEEQTADSYLAIGTGLGMIFGIIYLWIIFADITEALVSLLADGAPFHISTAFYTPLLLAALSVPFFETLMIRHRIIIKIEEKRQEIFEREMKKKVERRMEKFEKWQRRWQGKRWDRKDPHKKRWDRCSTRKKDDNEEK